MTTASASLWQKQGRSDQAYQLLTDILNWFAEDIESLDLKEAKSLLLTISEPG